MCVCVCVCDIVCLCQGVYRSVCEQNKYVHACLCEGVYVCECEQNKYVCVCVYMIYACVRVCVPVCVCVFRPLGEEDILIDPTELLGKRLDFQLLLEQCCGLRWLKEAKNRGVQIGLVGVCVAKWVWNSM